MRSSCGYRNERRRLARQGTKGRRGARAICMCPNCRNRRNLKVDTMLGLGLMMIAELLRPVLKNALRAKSTIGEQ